MNLHKSRSSQTLPFRIKIWTRYFIIKSIIGDRQSTCVFACSCFSTICPNRCLKPGFTWQNKAVYPITGRVNVLVRITDASKQIEREETSNSHTHTHIHKPQKEQTGNSHSVKSCVLHVSAQTTSSVISLVFEKFCLFVCYLLISVSWFVLFFTVFVFSTSFQLCHDRPHAVYRDPSFLFPKASKKKKKKKRAEAVSVAFLQSVHKTNEAMQGFTHFHFLNSSQTCVLKPRKQKIIFQKTGNHRSPFLKEEHISVCILEHWFMSSIVLHGRLLQSSVYS